MKSIDKVIAHFQSIQLRELVVPEWDMTIYCRPCTLEQKEVWFAKANNNTYQTMLYAIVYGALDEHGETRFTLSDKAKLNVSAAASVVERVALFILDTAGDSNEEREKN